jgi:uncharacterized protein
MIYHEGELALQERAGVQAMAQRIARGVYAAMPPIAQSFLQDQSIAVAGSVDAEGRVWASLLAGEPGFLYPMDAQTVRIEAQSPPGDPLADNIARTHHLGLIAIDFVTRQRIRLNGTAEKRGNGYDFTIQQAYSNCPKYIQVRAPVPVTRGTAHAQSETMLTAAQQQGIAQADTFFIASFHAEGGADASHRGGNPGFVQVLAPDTLVFPDYAGNMMFNTLGNISANPHVGLLFLDFETGSTLQLTGTAEIIWDEARVSQFAKAQHVIEFRIEQAIEITNAIPFQFAFLQASPHNPPV